MTTLRLIRILTTTVLLLAAALLLAGCAGNLVLRLPDGATLTSSRDTTIGSITVNRSADGAYNVTVSNYTGKASDPIDAQSRQIKTLGDTVTQIMGSAGATAAAAALKP
jgi:ABC-type glycerol-3-phosphate transport system substrate-binding protein